VDKLLGLREDTYTCGATASVALFHSLDSPAQPFYASRKLALTMAHVGYALSFRSSHLTKVRYPFSDTRAVLCATATGRAHALTETHHADGRTESARLRRTGTAVTADSFGETRFMGALANTRCLGDLRFKPFGVTPEPDMRVRLLDADGAAAGPTSTRAQATTTVIADGGAAFVVLVSDGVSSVVSDAEMCGLAREARSPQAAADAIVAFAEEMGSDDNLTAVVVPLAGWGAVRGPDETVELRSFRRTQMGAFHLTGQCVVLIMFDSGEREAEEDVSGPRA
jgi:protein phosphatase PTC6